MISARPAAQPRTDHARRIAVFAMTAAFACGVTLFAATRSNGQTPPAAPAQPPAPVEIDQARRADFAPVLWVPGGVFSREDARVANELAGRVTRVAEVGERVKRGEPLARIDDAMLRLQEARDRAEIARIEAELDYAASQEDRLAQLVAKASIAGSQLDEQRSRRQMLEQDLARAKVALQQTRHQLSQATVAAPFDGVVAERYVQVGEYLATGQAVVRLVNTQALEVRAQAPVSLVPMLAEGDMATVRADGALLDEPIRAIVPVGDETSRQFELRLALAASSKLPIGTPVQVALPSAEPRTVVAVPRDALLLRKDGTFVVRMAADGTAERVSVQTGAVHEGLVEVQGAIVDGDTVVVRGGERVAPGQPLAPTEAVAGGASAATSNIDAVN